MARLVGFSSIGLNRSRDISQARPPNRNPSPNAVAHIGTGDRSRSPDRQNATLRKASAIAATYATMKLRQRGHWELCKSSRHNAGTKNTATINAATIAEVLVQASGEK